MNVPFLPHTCQQGYVNTLVRVAWVRGNNHLPNNLGGYRIFLEANRQTANQSVPQILWAPGDQNQFYKSPVTNQCSLLKPAISLDGLRYCATNRKVAGSIPGDVTGIYQ